MWNKSIKTVLLLEDNPGDARLLREMLNEQSSLSTQLTHLECMSDAEKHLAGHAVDIILLDLGLPDAQGLEAIRRAQVAAPTWIFDGDASARSRLAAAGGECLRRAPGRRPIRPHSAWSTI